MGEDPPDDDRATGLAREPAGGSACGSRPSTVFGFSHRTFGRGIDFRA
jgi:hypothetical protein